jgi:hypothetical protein
MYKKPTIRLQTAKAALGGRIPHCYYINKPQFYIHNPVQLQTEHQAPHTLWSMDRTSA